MSPRFFVGRLSALGLLTALLPFKAYAACPDVLGAETPEDCPWADVARQIIATAATTPDVSPQLEKHLPALVAAIRADAGRPELWALWGQSVNFDDNAKATIVQPEVLAAIGKFAGLALTGRETHAGLTHSYGYLLSNLKTPYGYKRARWVKPTFDEGFGFKKPTLAPLPAHGTLLANSTALFGAIAFQDDPVRLAVLKKATVGADPELVAFPVTDLTVRRLTETVPLKTDKGSPRTVRLYTDVVTLPRAPSDSVLGLTHLLIYSFDDSLKPGAQLITGFPVDRAYAAGVFAPKGLGRNQPVKTRYNAYIAGLTGRELRGDRVVSVPATSRNAEPLVLNDNDWPPFFFAGKSGSPRGLAKELLEYCLPTTGRAAVFTNFSIKRMRRAMASGDLDTNLYSYAKERDPLLYYGKEPLFRNSYQPIIRAGSDIKITKIQDFDSLRLGHLGGLSYSSEFKAYINARQKAGTLDITDSEDSNFKKLLSDRINVYVNSVPTVLWLAKERHIEDQIKVLPFVIKQAGYFVTFAKASKRLTDRQKHEFLDDMDSCIQAAKKDGAYERIIAPYGQKVESL